MHCPRCGQQQNSKEIRFCSKCGLEMSDVKELLVPELREIKARKRRERNKAARQGFVMMISGFALMMILALLRDFFTVPKSFFILTMLIFMIGGVVRMLSPLLFGENNLPKKINYPIETDLETNKLSGERIFDKSLPEAEYRPPLDFGAKIYTTNDLVVPLSVTESTTRDLEKKI